jgi:methionine-rich copper-binding protein CopC
MMRHLPFRRPGAILLAASLALFGVVSAVTAHAELVTPTPADGATVEGTPPAIGGVYNESMTVDGSSLKLLDASGKQIATGSVLPDDDKQMAIDPVPDLAPGAYTVESTTTSADDGDIDRRKWTFTVVAAATSSPTSTPAASALVPSTGPSIAPSAAPTAAAASVAPTPAASADGGSSTGSGGDVLLPILAAIVILVVIGGVLLRRRDRSTPSQP